MIEIELGEKLYCSSHRILAGSCSALLRLCIPGVHGARGVGANDGRILRVSGLGFSDADSLLQGYSPPQDLHVHTNFVNPTHLYTSLHFLSSKLLVSLHNPYNTPPYNPLYNPLSGV